jgi:hypothetical protein
LESYDSRTLVLQETELWRITMNPSAPSIKGLIKLHKLHPSLTGHHEPLHKHPSNWNRWNHSQHSREVTTWPPNQ